MEQKAEPDGLLFSQRYHIDSVFQEYCKVKGLDYCVLNFLCWIVQSDMGKAAIDVMHEEIHKE